MKARLLIVLMGLSVLATPFALDRDTIEMESNIGFDFAYYPADQEGYGLQDGQFAPVTYQVVESDGSAGTRDLGSTWGGVELKGYYTYRWIVPALRWSAGPLATGNNITVQSQTGLSPISFTEEVKITVTPVAVLQVFAGFLAGTGWNAQIFDGLGEVDAETGAVDDRSFEGLVTEASLGAAFQFDVAAVIPGDWNHIVMVFSPEWTYHTFSGVDETTPWSFEADSGDNYRGWTASHTGFLGYQPPGMALGTVGVLYETNESIGAVIDRAVDTEPSDTWNPGFTETKVGIVLSFAFGEAHSLTLLPQVSRERLPSEASVFNAAVQAREVVGSYWDAYRLAVSYRRSL